MANTYFFTGFPGFIASSLISEILQKEYEISRFYLLVLPELAEKSQEEAEKIAADHHISSSVFTIIPGDITKPQLAIADTYQQEIKQRVTHVFHLAAIYDLAVPQDLAYRVNVNGTRMVNDFVSELSSLERYVYFSTSYVAGNREGDVLETQLDENQSFKNHYEQTKYEAELLVNGKKKTIPITIIRPGIVVGESKTGKTIKFDGPYFILNFFEALRFLPILPYLGKGEAEGNFVPVDYIFQAAIFLAHSERGIGKTYQLTDPKPYRMKEVYRLLMKEYLGKEPRGIIPLSFARAFLSIPFFRRWVRVEKEALDYFACKARYDCTQTHQDLEGTGISCPDFADVVPAIVQFYKQHKHDQDKQLKIQ